MAQQVRRLGAMLEVAALISAGDIEFSMDAVRRSPLEMQWQAFKSALPSKTFRVGC